jgi:glucokinase
MFAMGIDVGGTNLRVGLIDSKGQLLLSFKEPTPTASIEIFLSTLTNLVNRVRNESGHPISGLGIGWPGTVDHKAGVVLETPNLQTFRRFPLIQEIQKRIKLPCHLDNDAKCAGLAEKKFGAAQSFQDFVLLTFGTGIGGAIFTNSQLVRGKSGLAGEIGHFCLYPKGLECSCGSRGCFEKYCSAIALEKRAQSRFGKNYSAREILDLSTSNAEFRVLIEEYVEDLSLALGSLTNIFDPEAIVFSGGLFTMGGGPLLGKLRERLNRQGFQSMKANLKLLPSTLEGKAGIIGAASLALKDS